MPTNEPSTITLEPGDEIFRPADFAFEWTSNNEYTWDRERAHKLVVRCGVLYCKP